MTDIQHLLDAGRSAIESASTSAELEAARVAHLGRSAPLVMLLRSIPELPPEERGRVGKEGNVARRQLEELAAGRADTLEQAELEARLVADRIDVTLPAMAMPMGTLHPLTHTRRRIEEIFLGMGYTIGDGPEVESEWYNFTALNTPSGHPARSSSDTYYLHGTPGDDDAVILRTQTSPVQIRAMQLQSPPLYMIMPGRVYRRDEIDASHSNMFHQVEGLAVDAGLTLGDLKGTLEAFCRAMFGSSREVRLRTHFFPFTEPSVEVDLSCYLCDGTGAPAAGDVDFDRCRLCRGEGWLEIMGAGMVDPNVFAHLPGYGDDATAHSYGDDVKAHGHGDANAIRGFAFGMGVERIAMLRHSIPDMRLLFDNDLRVLAQFPGR
jgi:phenylalanyl-tRNA synthetase alpha chain